MPIPTEERNFTIEAQKILSCIYRMGKPYPLPLVLKVLIAEQERMVYQLGFDELSTYGILKRYDKDYVFSMIQKLVELGYIKKKAGGIWLSAKAKAVLFDHEEVIAELPVELTRVKPVLQPRDREDLYQKMKKYIAEITPYGRIVPGDQLNKLVDALPETHYEFCKIFKDDFFVNFEKEILAIIADYIE